MNTAPKDYVEAHDMQTRDAADLIEEFSDELADMFGRCVDIGCGPGTVTRKLLLPRLPDQAHVVGADLSKDMVELAKDLQAEEKRLSFIEFDVQADKVPKDLISAFDNAVSFYCLHWCQKVRQVFDNIYQILKPGGRALVLFLAHNSGFDNYTKMSKNPIYQPYMKDVAKYIPYFQHCDNSRAKLKKIIEESGFEVQHCSFREKTFIYKSLDILDKHVQAINPFLSRMPKELGDKFSKELLREIANEKILFANKSNGSKEEEKVLDRYYVLIAYFKKPNRQSDEVIEK